MSGGSSPELLWNLPTRLVSPDYTLCFSSRLIVNWTILPAVAHQTTTAPGLTRPLLAVQTLSGVREADTTNPLATSRTGSRVRSTGNLPLPTTRRPRPTTNRRQRLLLRAEALFLLNPPRRSTLHPTKSQQHKARMAAMGIVRP